MFKLVKFGIFFIGFMSFLTVMFYHIVGQDTPLPKLFAAVVAYFVMLILFGNWLVRKL